MLNFDWFIKGESSVRDESDLKANHISTTEKKLYVRIKC